MTFAQIFDSLQKRWWLPILFSTIFLLSWWIIVKPATEYQINITFNITTLNDKEIVQQAIYPYPDQVLTELDPEQWKMPGVVNLTSREYAYIKMLRTIRGYFYNRFGSIEVQSQIAKQIGYNDLQKLNQRLPFYKIYTHDLGSLSFEFRSKDKTQVEKFESSVLSTFEQLIAEWNQEKDIFAVKLSSNPIPASIVTVSPSWQQYALPWLAGLVFGSTLSLLWPNKSFRLC